MGSDADFTIVDLKCKYTVRKEELHSCSKTTAFDGEELTGKPVYTIVRGNIVMDHGCVAEEQKGIFLN